MYQEAKQYFEFFIKENFDLNDPKVSHKLNHTYHVVDNAEYICNHLKLGSEDKELAMVIALLHDIGRFDQAIQMKTFREDITGYDHATLGVKLLFEAREIEKFIKDRKYDEVIKKAIGNHSKYLLDVQDLNEREVLHCKIIRDADKIDSFRGKATDDIFTMANITEQEIESSLISERIYHDFMNEKTILSKDRKTGIDIWLSYIAFVFGLEFHSSLQLIKERDYINMLFDRFSYNQEKDRMELLRKKALDYVEKKTKDMTETGE